MTIANRISVFRILLIPFFVLSIVYARFGWALAVFCIASISDAVDGYIARACNQNSAFGSLIDPLADKLLLVSAFICLSMVESVPAAMRIPAYVTVIVLSRDCILVIGTIITFIVTGSITIKPSLTGKLTTIFQMCSVIGVLIHFTHMYPIWNIAVIFTIISGTGYIKNGVKVFNEQSE